MSGPIGTIRVQVGQQQGDTVRVTNGIRTLRGSADLKIDGAQTGDVIAYQANTSSFVMIPVTEVIPNLDAGEF